MPRAKPTTLDTILARAAELRAAGITSLTLDGVAVTLAPPEPTMPDLPRTTPTEDADATRVDPMSDAATYGGGKVPGFKRPKREQE